MITQAEVNVMIMQAVRREEDRRFLEAIYIRAENARKVREYFVKAGLMKRGRA